jgi:nucleoid-associated protein YgaU
MEVKDGYVHEEDGKLKIGGTVPYAYDRDRIWDEIKKQSGWETEVDAQIEVGNAAIYGIYEVVSGDTLWKIAEKLFGKGNLYMKIFEANKDQLKNPDVIKVGQKLRMPNP